ncbi:TPA: hypothetical protein IUZ37_001328 [Enterococcus faecalis]|nr:hypothetical protein [Enterococcus faecalis]HAP5321108.1 hypothetical protein [Enterococcus faecalis]HAP5690368.1 hypothetical protein [Enterococcus faecalis]
MKSYWYVSLTHEYPQPKHSTVSMRVVMSVQIKKNASIVEMTREATPKEIDACKLVYCGHGYFDEKNIQENIKRSMRD